MVKKNWFRKNKKNIQEIKEKASKPVVRKGGVRRYSFLVEDVYESSRLQGVMVQGTIHGKIREGDTMYLYQPEKETKEVRVLTIETGPREIVETARNTKVAIGLDLEGTEEISRFAVLSSIAPQSENGGVKRVENPRLFGLMMEYQRLYTNNVYMDALVRELCLAEFVLPLYIDRPPLPQEDGTFAFGEDAQVGFRSLKKWDDETKTVFPAFTDEVALMAWKNAFHEQQPRRLVGMFFPKIMEYVEKGHAGLIMNAFGPVPVYFPVELLRQVQDSNFYKKLYEKPEANEKMETNEKPETNQN